MRGLVRLAVAFVALAFAGAAPAATVTSLERTALAKLKRAPVSADDEDIGALRDRARRTSHPHAAERPQLSHPRLAARDRFVPRRATQPRALALYGALKANDDYFAKHWAPRRLDRHRRRRRRRVPLLRRPLLPVPPARELRCAERARDIRRRRRTAAPRRRARSRAASTRRAAASAGSTTSRSRVARPRGSPAWRRRSPRRRSREPRRRPRRTGGLHERSDSRRFA